MDALIYLSGYRYWQFPRIPNVSVGLMQKTFSERDLPASAIWVGVIF